MTSDAAAPIVPAGSGSAEIERVVARMDALRAGLDPADGLARFVDIYRPVTALMATRDTDGTFADPAFVADLDVRFASLFLDVSADLAAGRDVGKAWAPLVERRGTPGILPIQFVLAGMNAHINHDLAVAVVETCAARGCSPTDGPVHADFERVNGVLAELVRPMRQEFLDKEVVELGRPFSPVADLVSSFSIEQARDAAWVAALTLWHLRPVPVLARDAEQALARTVGLVGRQLLTVVAP